MIINEGDVDGMERQFLPRSRTESIMGSAPEKGRPEAPVGLWQSGLTLQKKNSNRLQ
jgi:hypothetical protein